MSDNCNRSTISSLAMLEDVDKDEYFFTKEKVITPINLFKKYKGQVSKGEIKSMKRLWEKISFDLSNKYEITIIPSKCENKFKVLERAYKKVKDNNSKSGRGRKDFPYETEFDEIFGRKLNINPKILLSSSEEITNKSIVDTVLDPCTSNTLDSVKCVTDINISNNSVDWNDTQNILLTIPETIQETPQKRKRPTKCYTKRNDILMEMKNDFKAYYVEKLKIEKEKLEEKKKGPYF